MQLTLNDYLESVNNPNGRFRTLEDIYPVIGADGNPVMFAEGGLGVFRCICMKEECLLICFLTPGQGQRTRYMETAMFTKLADSPYIPPLRYLEKEMLVFDSWGRPHYVDVAVKKVPAADSLEATIEERLQEGKDGFPAGALVKGIADMARWMAENDFAHGRISSRTIRVRGDNSPVLLDYGAATRMLPCENIFLLGVVATAVYLLWCEPRLKEILKQKMLFDTYKQGRLSKRDFVRELAAKLGDDAPQELASLMSVLSEFPDDRESVLRLCDCIEALGSCPWRKMEALSRMAEAGGMAEASSQPADTAKKYQFVGPMCDLLIRAFDGRRWVYLDKHGEVAIDGDFIFAGDFYEGRAVVEAETGFGMIDNAGRYIIPPDYDDIDIDQFTNMLIVTNEGVSGLFSREGESVTGLIYDQIVNSNEGLFPVKKNGRFGYIRRDGSVVVEIIYEDALGFRNGVGRVVLRGREYLIDTDGNSVAEIVNTMNDNSLLG